MNCDCYKAGSRQMTCDPKNKACDCLSGVGGLKCDKCKPGYWGLNPETRSNYTPGCASMIKSSFFFLFLSHIPIALYLHDKIWSLWVIFPNFPFQVATVISLVQIAQIVTKIMANVCVTMGSKVTIVRCVKQTILLCHLMCVEQKVWTKREIE